MFGSWNIRLGTKEEKLSTPRQFKSSCTKRDLVGQAVSVLEAKHVLDEGKGIGTLTVIGKGTIGALEGVGIVVAGHKVTHARLDLASASVLLVLVHRIVTTESARIADLGKDVATLEVRLENLRIALAT